MWSIALKAPKGRRVQWMDSDTPGKWEMHKDLDIDAWTHKTLLKEDWDGWIMYNDEPPVGKASGTSGHTKGVIVWNASKAGWLVHSVPLWPPAFTETLDAREILDNIKDDQVEFGQSFAWVDIAREDLQGVLRHVALMQPSVYVVNDPKVEWQPMERAPKDKQQQIQWLHLQDGLSHIAKCRQWGQCLFKEGLNAKFGGPCVTETWCRPKPVPTADVVNAVVLAWPGSQPSVAYHETQDHSKYAYSEKPENKWAYVGDINNMKSQWKRGGGGFVFTDGNVREGLQSLVHTTDAIA